MQYMQYLIPYGVLAFLGLGAIGLFASLVQLFRRSIRTPKPRPEADPDRFREAVSSTRSALMELHTILSSEISAGALAASQMAGVARLGWAEVELLQKVRKYQLVQPESQEETVKIH